MKEILKISDDVIIEYDGSYYRAKKNGELVAYSDVYEEAISYAKHYVDYSKLHSNEENDEKHV